MHKTGIVALLIAGAVVSAVPVEAEVSVNVNIGAPPVIFAAPPRVVLVPGTPVYYAPDTSYNVFFHDGRYYSFHNGAWFLARSHAGPWAFVPIKHVPRAVVMVPTRYYKIPPGHAKKMMDGDRDDDGRKHGQEHGHGRGHGHGHDRNDR